MAAPNPGARARTQRAKKRKALTDRIHDVRIKLAKTRKDRDAKPTRKEREAVQKTINTMTKQVRTLVKQKENATVPRVIQTTAAPVYETVVVCAFPGTGKSWCCRNAPVPCLDSDSSKFSWIASKTAGKVRNHEWPLNYVRRIEGAMGSTQLHFISTHKEVREALRAVDIPYVLVYPERGLKQEYMDRYRGRGNDEGFLKTLDTQWDAWLDDLEQEDGCSHIVLSSGQYMSDVIPQLTRAPYVGSSVRVALASGAMPVVGQNIEFLSDRLTDKGPATGKITEVTDTEVRVAFHDEIEVFKWDELREAGADCRMGLWLVANTSIARPQESPGTRTDVDGEDGEEGPSGAPVTRYPDNQGHGMDSSTPQDRSNRYGTVNVAGTDVSSSTEIKVPLGDAANTCGYFKAVLNAHGLRGICQPFGGLKPVDTDFWWCRLSTSSPHPEAVRTALSTSGWMPNALGVYEHPRSPCVIMVEDEERLVRFASPKPTSPLCGVLPSHSDP